MKTAKSQYKRYTRSKYGSFFYFVFLLAAGLFTVLPMIYSVLTSFKPLDELMIFPPRFLIQRPTVMNYLSLPGILSGLWVPFSRYVFNSVFVTVVTTALHIIIASMAAYVIALTDYRGRKLIFLIVQFSLLYNVFTLAVPQLIIFSGIGIVNTYLVYILPFLPSALGVFLVKQYMDDSVPGSLLEAAKIDGAGHLKIYWSIVMPIVKPAWLTLLLFTFRDVWAMPQISTVYNEDLKMLPYVMTQIVNAGIARAGSAMAATVLMMIPPILIYIVSQNQIIETMSSAGIKD